MMNVTCYSPTHANELAELFYQAVHAIPDTIYPPEQKQAWAPSPIDYSLWQQRFAQKKPYVLTVNGDAVGFIELETDGHIDCMYIAPNFQAKGVGTFLLEHIIAIAKSNHLSSLYVEASLNARAFFEKRGFKVIASNNVRRHGQSLINFSMTLAL